jgi:hypothetical protein
MVQSSGSRGDGPTPAAIQLLAESAGVSISVERATTLAPQAAQYFAALATLASGESGHVEPAAEFRLDREEPRR